MCGFDLQLAQVGVDDRDNAEKGTVVSRQRFERLIQACL